DKQHLFQGSNRESGFWPASAGRGRLRPDQGQRAWRPSTTNEPRLAASASTRSARRVNRRRGACEPMPMSISAPSGSATGIETRLRGVVEPLATLVRRAGSPDEERAAQMLVEAFEQVGTAARVEEVRFRDGYARLLMPLAVAGLVAGLRSSRGRRR